MGHPQLADIATPIAPARFEMGEADLPGQLELRLLTRGNMTATLLAPVS